MMIPTACRTGGCAPTRVAAAIASAFLLAGSAAAAPLVTLDRNGAFVAVEAYGPNIVHVTIAVDKAEVLKGPGHGVIAQHADNKPFQHRAAADGDTFTSSGMTLRINPSAVPAIPTQSQKYFAPSLAPVGLEVRNAQGQQILKMTGWEMSPQTVNEEKTYQVGAEFHAPADEHYVL